MWYQEHTNTIKARSIRDRTSSLVIPKTHLPYAYLTICRVAGPGTHAYASSRTIIYRLDRAIANVTTIAAPNTTKAPGSRRSFGTPWMSWSGTAAGAAFFDLGATGISSSSSSLSMNFFLCLTWLSGGVGGMMAGCGSVVGGKAALSG